METVGERIKNIRTSKGFTQADLADVLDTTTAAISRYEQSKRELRLVQVQAIADFLGVSIFELYGIPSDRQAEIESTQKFIARIKEQIQKNLENPNETALAINEGLQLAVDSFEKKIQDEINLAAVIHKAQVEVALITSSNEAATSPAPRRSILPANGEISE